MGSGAFSSSEAESAQGSRSESNSKNHGDFYGFAVRPKRAAACLNFKEKRVRICGFVQKKKERSVHYETSAIELTCDNDNDLVNRRLTDFTFHNSDGIPRLVEMLEVDDLFISGCILPLEQGSDKENNKGIRCNGFGRIESWAISGYEEGSPVIWVSTDIADYECLSPSKSYKSLYDQFYEKARACVEVYKKLSRGSERICTATLDELLAGVVRSMSRSKCFSTVASVKDFIISNGDFIYEQLVSLDESSKELDMKFEELDVLAALRDESRNRITDGASKIFASNTLLGQNITDIENASSKDASDTDMDCEIDSLKLARLLQEEQDWQGLKRKRGKDSSSPTITYYVQVSEDEIAHDYPLPEHYKPSVEEADELLVFSNVMDTDRHKLSNNILLNWSIYNSDSRFISLELLPMNSSLADIGCPAFGSGVMVPGDESETFGDDSISSAGGINETNVDGISIFLSGIKEWKIELGSSSKIFISIRTDMAW